MNVFYFSGIEKAATAQILSKTGAAGMMSQLLYNQSLIQSCGAIPLVMDSGSYTKALTKKDIEAYAALIVGLGTRCIWYANADCIGNQEKSNENYKYLLSLLPEILHPRILWIYQYGADLGYLHRGLQQHQQIGIGGLVPLLKTSDKQATKHIILSLAAIIQQYQRDTHYFGLSIPSIIETLQGYHHNFSVDSTTWLMGGKYGLLINAEGKQTPAGTGGFDFSVDAILEQNVRTMRKWVEYPTKKTNNKQHIQLSFVEATS